MKEETAIDEEPREHVQEFICPRCGSGNSYVYTDTEDMCKDCGHVYVHDYKKHSID